MSALMIAAKAGKTEVLKELTAAGAAVSRSSAHPHSLVAFLSNTAAPGMSTGSCPALACSST